MMDDISDATTEEIKKAILESIKKNKELYKLLEEYDKRI